MKCLILAAGEGSRIKMRGESKPLIPFLGVPLIERVINNFKKFNVEDFVIVLGYKGEEVKKYLDRLKNKYNIRIDYVYNEDWNKGNGLSLKAAKDLVNEPFILTMTDHLFDEKVVSRFLAYIKTIEPEGVILAIDRKNGDNIDIKDVTKVYTENNKIVQIGKGIQKYNAFDTGLFYCTPDIFIAANDVVNQGKTTLSDVISELATRGKAKTFDISDGIWFDVDTESMFKKAEKYFLKKYSTSDKKSNLDGPISRLINRKISLTISRHISYKSITPMQISIFSFILSLISGIIFTVKGYIPLMLAGIIAQVSSIIDGCDGEIARIKNMDSETGGWIDSVLDRYADSFILIGLTIHSSFYINNIVALLIGFLAIIGSLINSYTADKYDRYLKKKLAKRKGMVLRLGRDVRIFIIFLGAIFNMHFITLILIALITNIENLRRLVIINKDDKYKVRLPKT